MIKMIILLTLAWCAFLTLGADYANLATMVIGGAITAWFLGYKVLNED